AVMASAAAQCYWRAAARVLSSNAWCGRGVQSQMTQLHIWLWQDRSHWKVAAREIAGSALLHRRRGQGRQIGLCFFNALSGRLLEPQSRLCRVWLAGGAFGEVAAEHQLGLAVAQLGRGAETALGGNPVLGQGVAARVERGQCEHRAAVSLGGGLLEEFLCRN